MENHEAAIRAAAEFLRGIHHRDRYLFSRTPTVRPDNVYSAAPEVLEPLGQARLQHRALDVYTAWLAEHARPATEEEERVALRSLPAARVYSDAEIVERDAAKWERRGKWVPLYRERY